MKSLPHKSLPSAGLRRRSFLKGVLATGTLTFISPNLMRAGTGDKVRLACIGIGNRGADDIKFFHQTGLAEIVALCDTDMGAKQTEPILKLFPNLPRFQDFRKLFDKMGKEIDAVTIAVPDFSHFSISMLAMSLGKHVYVEKPMAHSFRQIELMMAAEKKYNVHCQMGNQGHSEANYFQFKAWVDAGIIKNVTKITTFMNNPRRWHGMKVNGELPEQPVPETLDWDCWLTTARQHAYNEGYTHGDWRSWFMFGNGTLGDWGAHIFDTAHEFLNLGLPTEVDVLRMDDYSNFIFPQASTLAFRFPARGAQPPVELTWYEGQKNPPPLPPNFNQGIATSESGDAQTLDPGKVIYGEGLTFKGGSHGSILRIIGGERAAEIKSHLPKIPKSPSNHAENFLNAVKGEETCRSNFAVAGPLCQSMALGVIAQRVNAKLAFDPATRKITNHKLANELLNGVPPRKGWEQYYKL